jgi:VAD1 Analog of StAR-related lipid transfer domain
MLIYLLVVAIGSVIMSLTGGLLPNDVARGTSSNDPPSPRTGGCRADPVQPDETIASSSRIERIQHSSSSVDEVVVAERSNEGTGGSGSSSSGGKATGTATSSSTGGGLWSYYSSGSSNSNSNSEPPQGAGEHRDNPKGGPAAAIEGRVGAVAGEYTCAYDGANGSLYAGSRGLYFESWTGNQRFWMSFLGDTGKAVLLRWEQVRKVVKLEHGIRVQCVATADGEDEERVGANRANLPIDDDRDDAAAIHDFQMHLVDLDRVWLLLISLQNDSIMGREPSPVAASRRLDGGSPGGGAAPGSMRRRNSDPLLSSMVRVLDETMIVEDPAAIATSPLPPVAVVHHEPPSSTEAPPPPRGGVATAPILPSHAERTELPKRTVTDSFVFSTAGLDMHDVERLAGKLSLQPIQCIHESVKGKLYAGKAAVYFYGRKYFWDKKEVFLKWDMIRQIRMIDAKTALPTGDYADDDDTSANPTVNSSDSTTVCVGIRIVAKDGRELHFLRVDQADRVWAMLVSLHNENLTSSSRQLRRKSQHRQSLRRMNSDPTILSVDTSDGAGLVPLPSREGDDGDEGKAMSTGDGAGVSEKPKDDTTDWADLQASALYANVVVKDLVLHGTTLDKIFDKFLQDDADCSLARFLESRGDSNLRESRWKASEVRSSGEYTRVVHYTHPVNAPLAPPMANARKEQRYRRYANLGLCLWTKTIVDDVPMTDCFFVADRLLFTVLDQDRVSVRMEFDITFIKSTMFKSIISRTTSSEVTSGLQAHAVYMSAALGDNKGVIKVSAEVPQMTAPATVTTPVGESNVLIPTPLLSRTIILLLLVIVILQLYVLRELGVVKGALKQAQQQGGMLSVNSDGTCSAGGKEDLNDGVPVLSNTK